MIAQHLINTSPSTAGVKKTIQESKNDHATEEPNAHQHLVPRHRLTIFGNSMIDDDTNAVSPCDGKIGYENDQGKKAAAELQSIYDYGDAAPDVKKERKQSYHDDDDDCSTKKKDDGEEDNELLPQARSFSGVLETRSDSCHGTETPPRRSSLKQKDGSSPRAARRASIQMGEEITVRLPGRKELVRRRSFISFSSDVRVRPIVPVSKLSKNPEKLWFQNDELTHIKQKSWKIVHDELLCQVLGRKSKYCTRGLERLLMPDKAKQNKHSSWDTVILEQELQRNKGIFDEQCLASKYQCATANSQLLAQERAKEDEAEIQQYLRSTKRYVRRLSIT